MKDEKETVCAVVVTYNRKNYLLDCLESLKHQSLPPDAILIVDNASTDGTPEALKKAGYISDVPVSDTKNTWETHGEVSSPEGEKIKIHYLRLPQNTGGAGGFYHGMKRAYELGYTWIWIMDDDVVASKNALEKLNINFKNSGILALASMVKRSDGSIFLNTRGFLSLNKLFPRLQIPLSQEEYKKTSIPVDFASFVGLMVKREAISEVGFPNPDFFIYNDDVEYGLRLGRYTKILLIPGSVLIDRSARKEAGFLLRKFLFLRLKRLPLSSYWRTYYSLRNSIYIGKKYARGKALFYLRFLVHLLKSLRSLLLILTLDDHKKDRLKIRFLPYIHGLRGVLGKKVEYKNGKIIWH